MFAVPLENSSIVSFDCSRIVYSLIFVLSSPQQLLEVLFAELL